MRTGTRLLSLLIVTIALSGVAHSPAKAQVPAGMDSAEYLRLRAEHIAILRGYEPGKPFDPTARPRALEIMAAQFARAALSGPNINATSWTPIGPAPIPNGQTSPSVPVSGRVTAIAIHPTDPNKAYVGTAQGGLYRTLDGGTTWSPLLDTAQSLAIGAVTINPSDPTVVFVGTGEGNLSLDSFFGVGLYRIINADTTATLEGPFESRTNGGNGHAFIGTSITKIVVDPTNGNNVFVGNTLGFGGISGDEICCGGTNPPSAFVGLYLSTNALAATPTFVRVNPASLPGGGVAGVTDIAMEPGNANTLVIGQEDFGGGALASSGIFRSTNALLGTTSTWTETLNLSGTQRNIKFAINKVAATVTVLAATEESSGTLRKSTDGGATWPTILAAANGFCDGQCFYDIIVALDPADANIVYLGGNVESGSQRLFAKSINGGATFTNSSASLHADQHAIAIAPSNTSIIYDGNDGGIWTSSNAGSNWTSLNNTTFSATQFQSLALHPTDREFMIGGTQDNGTPLMKADGTWTRADFGDGGFSLIDQGAPDTTTVTMYHTYFNQTSNLIGFARVNSSPCATDGQWSFKGRYTGLVNPTVHCDGTTDTFNGILLTDPVLFYAPMALGPGTPNTVYFGTDKLYRSTNKGDAMTVVSQVFAAGNKVSAIGVSRQDDNVRVVGLSNGKVFATTTGSSTLIDVTGPIPAKYVARAVIDPNNVNTAYVTLAGFGLSAAQHVWKTTNLNNATPTWTASGNGIPDVPVDAIVVDPANSNALYAGTDIGVYSSTDGGANWSPFGTGLPPVAVFDMAIQSTFGVLRIATHGRGIWEILASQPPDLSIAKTHVGNFTQGQVGATYTITVSNAVAAGPTDGTTVTVTDTVPGGLTATAINGTGWTCTQPSGTCTRSDVLNAGSSYPPITLTVTVGAGASSPQVNMASVSGGGDVTPADNSASDSTVINVAAAPTITSANNTTFTFGAAGTFTVMTTGSPVPAISKTGALPTGVTFVDNGNGTATLAGTPTVAGGYPLTITANNGVAPNATQAFTLTVNATVPGAPTGAMAVPGNAQASVSFSAPSSNGGSAITGYTVASNPAGGVDSNAGTTATTHVVAGLINGTSYTFMVTAANSVGTGPPSAPSNAVTPVSNNANLANLVLSAGTLSPPFSSGTLSYSANVVSNNNAITVTPTVADPTATIKVNGVAVASGSPSAPITLNPGSNLVTTVVTAQDGVTTKSYTVNVNYMNPSSCTYSVSPLDLSNSVAAGGVANITVTTPSGCPVAATSYQPWVTVNSITPNGGTTTVQLQISPNAGAARATSIVVADRLFLITQAGP